VRRHRRAERRGRRRRERRQRDHRLVRDQPRQACALLTAHGRAQLERSIHIADCELAAVIVGASYDEAEKRGIEHIRPRRATVTGDRATIAERDIQFPHSIDHLQTPPNGRPIVLRRIRDQCLIEDDR
jgi:hypothetical protein